MAFYNRNRLSVCSQCGMRLFNSVSRKCGNAKCPRNVTPEKPKPAEGEKRG